MPYNDDIPIGFCNECNAFIMKFDYTLWFGEYQQCCPDCKSISIKELCEEDINELIEQGELR